MFCKESKCKRVVQFWRLSFDRVNILREQKGYICFQRFFPNIFIFSISNLYGARGEGIGRAHLFVLRQLAGHGDGKVVTAKKPKPPPSEPNKLC